jgi:hypothetical protein
MYAVGTVTTGENVALTLIYIYILRHVDALLDNDSEISENTTAATE